MLGGPYVARGPDFAQAWSIAYVRVYIFNLKLFRVDCLILVWNLHRYLLGSSKWVKTFMRSLYLTRTLNWRYQNAATWKMHSKNGFLQLKYKCHFRCNLTKKKKLKYKNTSKVKFVSFLAHCSDHEKILWLIMKSCVLIPSSIVRQQRPCFRTNLQDDEIWNYKKSRYFYIARPGVKEKTYYIQL